MAANEFAWGTRFDTTDAVRGALLLVKHFREIEAVLTSMGKIAERDTFKRSIRDFKKQNNALKELTKTLRELKQAQEAIGNKKTLPQEQFGSRVGSTVGEQRKLGGPDAKRVTKAELNQGQLDVEAQIQSTREALGQLAQTAGEAASHAGSVFDRLRNEVQGFRSAIEQARTLLGGGLEANFVLQAGATIRSEISKIREQMEELKRITDEQRSQGVQTQRARTGKQRAHGQAELENAAKLEAEIVAKREAGTVAAQMGLQTLKQTEALLKEISTLEQKAGASRAQGNELIRKADKTDKEADDDLKTAGLTPEHERLKQSLIELEALQKRLHDPNVVKQTQPALQALRQQLEKQVALIDSGSLSYEKQALAIQKAANLTKELAEETERAAGKKVLGKNKALTEPEFDAAKQQNLPGINRLFTNISKDLSRRFIATLQFAVSGALIFGVQKFVREFIKGAIEVERAFKDIESALEFDIEAPRGALEFRLQVEGVRREILLLSNEFNVLPTEANKAAFVMISRFQDTGNAMKALRAHLLATKVSTIDQSEVLRALTAVAEGFTASILEVNENLTLQDSLLQRETVSATLYARALDLAVQIQQKFGVEVEDTLEGGARATEVFRQMGFTMEETFAIVAATSRQLGQTGQQVAERLNRSLGQLTDPKIRDALLALSGTTKEFTLQISDFESGATAWKKIADEFQRLEKSSPAAARQILQIVGQRRELEAVAAALGTSDLQEAIVAGADEAAGSAEARFGFLAVTVSEMIQSIAASMEELSQNFERLGGLNTFKLLFFAVDKLIGAFNDALKFLIDIRDAMNKAFNNGFVGTLVFQVGALGLALAGTLRVLFEIHRIYKKINETKAVGALADFFKLGQGLTVRGIVSGAAAGATATFGTAAAAAGGGISGAAAGTAALGAASAAKVAGGVKALHAGLTAIIPVWGQVALATIAVGVVLQKHRQRLAAFADDLDIWLNSVGDSVNRARKKADDEGLTGGARRQSILRDRIKDDSELLESGDISSVGGTGLGSIFQALTQQPQRLAGEKDLAEVLGDINTPSRVAGHAEFIQVGIDRMNRELFNSIADELLASVASTSFDENDQELIAALESLDSPLANLVQGSLGDDPIAKVREVMNKQIQEAIDLANKPGQTEGEIRANTAIAQTAIDSLVQDYEEFLRIFGELPDQLIKSVQQINARLAHIPTQRALGQITQERATFLFKEGADDLADRASKLRDDINGPADKKAAEEADRAAEEALQSYLESRRTTLNTFIRNGTRWLGEREALAFELHALGVHIEEIIFEFGEEAAAPEIERQADLIKAQAEAARALQLKEAALAVSLARNFESRRKAIESQIAILKAQADWLKDSDAAGAEALLAQSAQLQLALDKDVASEEIRLAIAKFRQGRTRDPRSELEAQIKGFIAKKNSEFASAADVVEASNSIADALRAIQLVEIQRLTAVALSRVSVRDSINEQLVALSALKQEMTHAVNVYGLSSKAHLDLARQIKQAEAALIDATLDMQSVNRQLSSGFDVTNPLQQAEEDFIRVSRQLQIPDLGDAERAALELELKNSEAARIGASFNEGLFQLKFQFERGTIGQSEYISALKGMLAATDLTTHQGQELWLQINSLIEGLTDDLSGAAFNIPGQIRIPTLFEVRRAVQAESLGVNYLDNRQQDINVYVSDEIQLDAVMEAIEGVFDVQNARMAPGGAGITMGAP